MAPMRERHDSRRAALYAYYTLLELKYKGVLFGIGRISVGSWCVALLAGPVRFTGDRDT